MITLTKHLRESDLTYFQHMRRALSISFNLMTASAACLIHAFFPFVLETNATSKIKSLYEKLEL